MAALCTLLLYAAPLTPMPLPLATFVSRRAVVSAKETSLVRENITEATALRVMVRYFPDTEPLALGMDVDVFKIHGVPCALVQHYEGHVGRVVLNKGMILIFGMRGPLLEQITQRYRRVGPDADISFLTAS
jgi:hypothetical protein